MSELIDELRKIDEITLLELLNVTSDDLIDAFLDRIQDNEDKLRDYLE
jgi:hypothetical protein